MVKHLAYIVCSHRILVGHGLSYKINGASSKLTFLAQVSYPLAITITFPKSWQFNKEQNLPRFYFDPKGDAEKTSHQTLFIIP